MRKSDFQRPEIIRPPSEARCYFLPLTSGCSNNSCTFCNFYGCKLQVRDLSEVKGEIDALHLYLKHAIRVPEMPAVAYLVADEWDGRRVFLQDGDALVHPQVKEVLEYLNVKFPALERVASYATPQDILRLPLEELKALKERKLGILYLGLESGNEEVLRAIGKGVGARQMVDAGRKAKAAGIILSVSVILGLGGLEKSREHAHYRGKQPLQQLFFQLDARLQLSFNSRSPAGGQKAYPGAIGLRHFARRQLPAPSRILERPLMKA
jgi:radical SAM superfamily enzyme YgiQ (UPF0313 family)